MTTQRYVGCDGFGVHRVYANSVGGCLEEIEDYIASRRDTGPVNRWSIVTQEINSQGHVVSVSAPERVDG